MAYIYVEFSKPISDYCEVTGTSFSTDYSGRGYAGGIGHRAQNRGFVFKKVDDYLNKAITEHLIKGTFFTQVRIEFYRTADSGLTLLYLLSNAMISSAIETGGAMTVGMDFGELSAEAYYGQ